MRSSRVFVPIHPVIRPFDRELHVKGPIKKNFCPALGQWEKLLGNLISVSLSEVRGRGVSWRKKILCHEKAFFLAGSIGGCRPFLLL